MKYAAPMANQMGWSIEETSAAMMKLADSGLKGSIAGQAFSSSVGRLSKLTPEAQKQVDKLGISFFDAKDNMKSIPDVIAELERGTAGLTMKQKTAALTTIFGAEAYKHWAILLEAGSDTLAEHTQGLENSDGTAQKMADTMVDNLAGSLMMLRSALEGLAIQFSDLIKDDIRAFADGLTMLAGKFSKLDDNTKKTILIVAGIAAAVGPVMVALSILIKSFMTVRSAIAGVRGALAGLKLVMMANPILFVVGALAALAAGLYFAYQKSETFRNVINPLLDVLKNVFVAGVTQVGATVSQILPTVIEAFKSLATPIKDLGSMVLPMLISAAEKVFPTLVLIVETAAPIIKSLISSLAEIFTNGIIPAVKALLSIVEAVFPIIQFVIENALTLITGIIQTAMALLQGDWSGAWEIIKETATTIMNNIIGFFEGINLFDVGISIINGLIDGIKSMGGAVLGAIGNLVPEPIKGAASKLLGKLPGFAEGGIVGNPTLAWIGEGGDTEAIIPWNNSQHSKDLWLQTGQQLGMLKDNGVFDNMQHQVSMQMQANESPAISPNQVAQSVPNQNNSNVIQLTYNPQYNVQRPEDLEQVKQHADKDKDDLEARIAEMKRDERRKSFGD